MFQKMYREHQDKVKVRGAKLSLNIVVSLQAMKLVARMIGEKIESLIVCIRRTAGVLGLTEFSGQARQECQGPDLYLRFLGISALWSAQRAPSGLLGLARGCSWLRPSALSPILLRFVI